MSLKMKKIIMCFIGVIITGISVGICQSASLGTDPFTSFITGLCNLFNISFGAFYTIICALMLVLVFRLDKHYIGIATIFNLFGNGFVADITRYTLERAIPELSFAIKIALLILGVIIMSLSASLYFTADLGVSTYDAISLIMGDRKVASFKNCRMITDFVCVIIGFSLKASVGIGTVITAIFMGPLIQWFNINVSELILYKNNIRP
ncbi:YczE/YyaS/YitT family protein [Clostridium tertium]